MSTLCDWECGRYADEALCTKCFGQMLLDAQAREREACAKLVEDHGPHCDGADLAKAIRARGTR